MTRAFCQITGPLRGMHSPTQVAKWFLVAQCHISVQVCLPMGLHRNFWPQTACAIIVRHSTRLSGSPGFQPFMFVNIKLNALVFWCSRRVPPRLLQCEPTAGTARPPCREASSCILFVASCVQIATRIFLSILLGNVLGLSCCIRSTACFPA